MLQYEVNIYMYKWLLSVFFSVAAPEPPGTATFSVEPEPEPIFLAGAESRSRLFKGGSG